MRHFEIKKTSTASSPLGKSIQHESARKQVSGSAIFVDDQPLPKQSLHAYPVLASIAHGRIKQLNVDAVKAMSGVVGVLTAADIKGKKDIGPVFPGDVLLAETQISYHGQPIALVIAQSYSQARSAARAMQASYEIEPAQLNVQHAIAAQDWVRPPLEFNRGDISQALANAPNRLKANLELGGQEHFYLEGQVALASPTEDGGIFVRSSTQHPTEVQHLIAEVLAIPFHLVTVEMRRMGGGFGGKETQAAPWAILAAMAAQKTGKTVKLKLAREDDFRLTGKRHPFSNSFHIGFNADGDILAADIIVNGHCGYSPDLSDAIVDRAMFHADNSYFYPAVRVVGNRVRLNTVSHTAFRGFGGPQGLITAEAILDEVAIATGKDPVDVRLKNLYRPGCDVTPYHQKIEEFVVADMMQALIDKADYRQRRLAMKAFNKQSKIIKKGLSLTPVKFGISFTVQHLNQAGALIHVYTDGSIQVNHGGTEMGQGLNTKVQQIVAAAFGVSVEAVLVSATRTDKVPNTSPTAASSGTDLNGMAALNAANTIKQRMIDFIINTYQVAESEVEFCAGHVRFPGGDLSFGQLCQSVYEARISLSSTGFYQTPKIHFDRDKAAGRPFFYYSHGVALTEVEVDTLTGENSICRVDILHDVGQSINPALDKGQIEGGFIQGMGWLTTEELTWQETGALASAGPATYKIPAIGDTPKHFDVQLYASKNPENTVFRSKAVGEPPFMLATSVWCALRDATASLTDYRYLPSLHPPATPEKILQAVNEAKAWHQQNTHSGAAHAE